MKMLELLDEFQFGPHTLKVTGIAGSAFDDPERMITAKCIETCCSDGRAILISMPAHELEALAAEYNEKLGTIKMKSEISKMMKRFRDKGPPKLIRPIPINEQLRSPLKIKNVAKDL